MLYSVVNLWIITGSGIVFIHMYVIWDFYHISLRKMMTSSDGNIPALLAICAGIHRPPVNSPHKGQWRGALMFSFNLCLNKRLSKQSRGWWFEAPSCPLWRHCNEICCYDLNDHNRIVTIASSYMLLPKCCYDLKTWHYVKLLCYFTSTYWKQMIRNKSRGEIFLHNEVLFLFSLVVRSGEGNKTLNYRTVVELHNSICKAPLTVKSLM